MLSESFDFSSQSWDSAQHHRRSRRSPGRHLGLDKHGTSVILDKKSISVNGIRQLFHIGTPLTTTMIAVLHGFLILLILSLLGGGFAVDEAPPRDCGTFLKRPNVAFCGLDVAWDVAVMTVASGAALASMILALVLLSCLRRIAAPDKRSGVGPLLLLLAGILGLCGLSFAYLIKREKHLCIARRTIWGTLLAMCFGCLVSQGVRLQRLVRGALSPSGRALAGLAVLLALVAPAWLLLNVTPEGLAVCQYNSLDLGLICTYMLLLLLVAMAGAACSLSGMQPQWRCNAAWLLATCLSSSLLWATWLTFYLYGNMALGLSSAWDDREQAVVLVVQAWLLLLVHAAPEAHACMHAAPQPSNPSDSAPSQAQPHLREASLEEGISLSHWQSRENQDVSVNRSNSGTSGSQWNRSLGTGPSTVFPSSHDQPTDIVIQN